jgi:hypothetical protein
MTRSLGARDTSLSGSLGQGEPVTARLTPGTHILTAGVTDRAGASASASALVTVTH